METEQKTQAFASMIKRLRELYSGFEVSRWFALGTNDQAALRQITTSINRKLYDSSRSDRRHATNADTVAASLLEFLERKGYDLSTLRYDENGQVVQLKRKKKS
ncbi:hypothetical protein [Marinobacter salarius]|uniref:Uncharacterized protein n=1 Tax=Marinobacter salarius TaxID=1420917 RepID=A0A1W6KFC3_9GAMM|nr:hypothetical protein [Marinobacter salarius]ARM86145.1 hypothetical protein MARSALSMR5_04125 [Marinobacter salarius]